MESYIAKRQTTRSTSASHDYTFCYLSLLVHQSLSQAQSQSGLSVVLLLSCWFSSLALR